MKDALHTPWSDEVALIEQRFTKDAQGFEHTEEVPHVLMCNWQDGVSQSEFYLSQKAGMRASAQVELHRVDLYEVWPRGTSGRRYVEFCGTRYEVLRDTPASIDTQVLILTEVIR